MDQHNTAKGKLKTLVEGDKHTRVRGKHAEKIEGDMSLQVGGKRSEKVGSIFALESGTEIHIKSGAKVIIECGMQLSVVSSGSFIDIGPAGVTIQGKLVLINNGGAAGTGSGAHPKDPDIATAEGAPGGPVASGGAPAVLARAQASSVPAQGRALQMAARTGIPFCES